MSVEIPRAAMPSALENARVVAVEGPAVPGATDFYDCGERDGGDYAVIRFDNGATLYLDAPALYLDVRDVRLLGISVLGGCEECDVWGVDLALTGADGRSVCDTCRDAEEARCSA